MNFQELFSKASRFLVTPGEAGYASGLSDVLLPVSSIERRLALRNCGSVNGAEIDDYIASYNGYAGLDQALNTGTPGVLDILDRSGLRDESGIVSLRLNSCNQATGKKMVVCNAIDAEPGSLSSYALLHGDPHAVFEGLLVAMYAAGAETGILCIDAGDADVKVSLMRALQQMEERTLVGSHVLDTDFSADIQVREIDAAPVITDETALLRAIEGQQPLPYLHDEITLLTCDGSPAIVASAEVLAQLSGILQNGPTWFNEHGTAGSPGTKIVSVLDAGVGRVLEVPFGTTLKELVDTVGGEKPVSLVRFGGVTGPFYAADRLDAPITFEDMEAAGYAIGSGILTLYRHEGCPVNLVGDIMRYLTSQSCGQCIFCREGTVQIAAVLKDIADLKAAPGDMAIVEEIAGLMKFSCICRFGKHAADPLLSSVSIFKLEYEAHINDKTCLSTGNK